MRRVIRLTAAGLLALSLSAGCASRTTTVRTKEQVRYPAGGAEWPSKPRVAETETTTTTTRHEPRGVLSTAVHVAGEIVALPFRLIGGLLRLIV